MSQALNCLSLEVSVDHENRSISISHIYVPRLHFKILKTNSSITNDFKVEVTNRLAQLEIEESENNIVLVNHAKITIPKTQKEKKQPWMTDEMLLLMKK